MSTKRKEVSVAELIREQAVIPADVLLQRYSELAAMRIVDGKSPSLERVFGAPTKARKKLMAVGAEGTPQSTPAARTPAQSPKSKPKAAPIEFDIDDVETDDDDIAEPPAKFTATAKQTRNTSASTSNSTGNGGNNMPSNVAQSMKLLEASRRKASSQSQPHAT